MSLRGGTTKQSHGSTAVLHSIRLLRYARNDIYFNLNGSSILISKRTYPFFAVDPLMINSGFILMIFGLTETSVLAFSWKNRLPMVLPI
ncbi:hypothetical protein SAMN05192574_101265 [Mucilaginibacter gossypiicola]|uniref:Uncharacterized protein n=1 Tax=Mucilaginibacter gossypiicola TaxID=551995 RepID=A0A1H7ZZ31_9SPHI|nr:hypothetical protein SAMN05192574_101265 [Mucilaginibacter gossypiicola]